MHVHVTDRALPDHPSKRTQTEGGKFLVAAEQQGDSSAATEAEAVAAAALSVAEGDAPAHEPPHSKEVSISPGCTPCDILDWSAWGLTIMPESTDAGLYSRGKSLFGQPLDKV